jgi:hypothetical protein
MHAVAKALRASFYSWAKRREDVRWKVSIWTAGYQRSVIARLKTDSTDVFFVARAAETNHTPHEAEWQIAWARLNKDYAEVVAGATS